MNYEEVKNQITDELKSSYEEVADPSNKKFYETIGVDTQNEMDRYAVLIDAFEIIVRQAESWDALVAEVDRIEKDQKGLGLSTNLVIVTKGMTVQKHMNEYNSKEDNQ